MENEIIVEFKGNSEKGKARVKKHGKKWRVVKERDYDRLFSGPSVTLESAKCKCMECATFGRGWNWIIGNNQTKDFKIVSVVPEGWESKVQWFNEEVY
jgi:hypothetical protein